MNSRQNKCEDLPLVKILRKKPKAVAVMNGSSSYPDIYGLVRFYQTQNGTVVFAEITGLPKGNVPYGNRIFGFHIHSGTSCSGNYDDPFADAMKHYSTDDREHPFHEGDLPPLFGNCGNAMLVFLTNRFNVNDVLGKAIIIHESHDDFTSQPAGNSGKKIACGIIRSTARN